jgi:hypothetical protein
MFVLGTYTHKSQVSRLTDYKCRVLIVLFSYCIKLAANPPPYLAKLCTYIYRDMRTAKTPHVTNGSFSIGSQARTFHLRYRHQAHIFTVVVKLHFEAAWKVKSFQPALQKLSNLEHFEDNENIVLLQGTAQLLCEIRQLVTLKNRIEILAPIFFQPCSRSRASGSCCRWRTRWGTRKECQDGVHFINLHFGQKNFSKDNFTS